MSLVEFEIFHSENKYCLKNRSLKMQNKQKGHYLSIMSLLFIIILLFSNSNLSFKDSDYSSVP